MKEYIKAIFLSVLIIFAILASSSIIVLAGDSAGNSRPQYTIDQINELLEKGEWGNKVVFNSITDSVIGSEFDFVGARDEEDEDTSWNGKNIVAEDGKIYLVRMYVDNNSESPDDWRETDIGVAKDTHVFFSIPKGSSTSIDITGFLDSSNATPNEYWDSITFKSANDEQFYLEYVPGSALIENNGYAANGGKTLSDDIVMKKEGTLIGYDGPDGKVPGGYNYDNYVTIRVKAVYDADYTIQKSVRFAGTTGKNWTDNLDVKIGDELEYQIVYTNRSNDTQHDVMIRDVLPENIDYISGSTKLWNGSFPDGADVDGDDIITIGINIGHYASGTNAVIRFRAVVVDNNLAYGGNTVVNWAQGGIGRKVIHDYANVHLWKVNWQNVLMIILIILMIICFIFMLMIFRKVQNIMNRLGS